MLSNMQQAILSLGVFIDPGVAAQLPEPGLGSDRDPDRRSDQLPRQHQQLHLYRRRQRGALRQLAAERARGDGGPRPGRALHDREAPAHGHVRRVPGAEPGVLALRDHGGPGRQHVVRRDFGPKVGQGLARGRGHRSSAATRRSAGGHRPRIRRQSLVHRAHRAQHRPDHARGRRSREFPIPSSPYPYGITAGPDGNLWFTGYFGNKIGRVTTAGAITEFPVYGHCPPGSRRGPDGNLWFTEISGNKIGRITTAGRHHRSSPIPTANSQPAGDHGRARREPLVHRVQRQQDRAHHARRA